MREFGGLMRYYFFMGQDRLMITDPEIMKQVFVTNSKNYIKPPARFKSVHWTPASYTSISSCVVPLSLIASETTLFVGRSLVQKEWTLEHLLPGCWGSLLLSSLCLVNHQYCMTRAWRKTRRCNDPQWPGSQHSSVQSFSIKLFVLLNSLRAPVPSVEWSFPVGQWSFVLTDYPFLNVALAYHCL